MILLEFYRELFKPLIFFFHISHPNHFNLKKFKKVNIYIYIIKLFESKKAIFEYVKISFYNLGYLNMYFQQFRTLL